MIVLPSLSGRQAKGLRHSNRGHRPRNTMAPETSRPVRAFQPGPSRAVTKFAQFAYKALWQKSVFISVHLWLKNPEIAKRTQFSIQVSINQNDMHVVNLLIKVNQGYSNLFNPRRAIVQNPASPNSPAPIRVRNGWVTPIIAYLHLFAAICAFSREKKDCLFFAAPTCPPYSPKGDGGSLGEGGLVLTPTYGYLRPPSPHHAGNSGQVN
jgi:hypothetical protein